MAQVLIVNDDKDIRDTVRLVLEDSGYAVVEAEDGLAALRLLSQGDQHYVVVLDQRMPGMDGTEVLRQMIAQPAHARRHVFILATAASDATLQAARPLVAEVQGTILLAPYDIDDLLAAVAAAASRLVEEAGGSPSTD